MKHSQYAMLACASLSVGCGAASTQQAEKPNVILIMVDDQGYADIGAHGNDIIQTPNIDALHAKSSRFTQFHVSPTSSPTRAALMTGRNCNNAGVWHTVNGRSLILERETTMAQIFKDNGYETAIFGKWHLGDSYPFRPEDKGFDYTLTYQGGGVGQSMDYWDNDYFDDMYRLNGVLTQYEGYSNDVWFDSAAQYASDNRDKPFFCYIASNVVHSPYWVDEKYSAPYRDVENVVMAEFYGMIANLDENIGKLTAHLEKIGLMDNTILIFSTDNGTAQGAKVDPKGDRLDGFVVKGQNAGMRGIKASMYEGGHRVPLYIHWKDGGISVGKDVNDLVAHYDILPTLVDLCGLEVSPEVAEKLDGQSLKPLIEGSDNSKFENRYVVVDSQRNDVVQKWYRTALMKGDWRLVNGVELYDLTTDPEQRVNIAAAHPEKMAELLADYEEWWEKNSPNFVEEPYFIIGNKAENPTHIYGHDWHTTKTSPWQQHHIRIGYSDNGYWLVKVDEDGTYEFKLRRWPVETGLKLHDKAPIRPAIEGTSVKASVAGKSLPIVEARISIQGQEQSVKVAEGDEYAKFTLNLKKGETRLWTYFKMGDGRDDIGAYYVEIEKL